MFPLTPPLCYVFRTWFHDSVQQYDMAPNPEYAAPGRAPGLVGAAAATMHDSSTHGSSAAANQTLSENDLFTHLTGYYARFAPGAKTEQQLRDMASRVKVVSF